MGGQVLSDSVLEVFYNYLLSCLLMSDFIAYTFFQTVYLYNDISFTVSTCEDNSEQEGNAEFYIFLLIFQHK